MWKHFPVRVGGAFEFVCLAIGAIFLVMLSPAEGNSQGLEGLDRVSVRVVTDWYAIPANLTVEDVELSVYITLRRMLPRLTVDLVERTDPWIDVNIQSLPIRADGTEIGYAIYVETSLVRKGSIEFSDIGSERRDEIQVPVWSDSARVGHSRWVMAAVVATRNRPIACRSIRSIPDERRSRMPNTRDFFRKRAGGRHNVQASARTT